MKVKDCMCKQVSCVNPNATICDVAKIMNQEHVGCVPVCENNKKIVGFVTDRDIVLRAVSCGKDINTAKVSDIMTTDVIKTTPDTDIGAAADILKKNQIRRIPVIEDGNVVGILSLGDMARNDHVNATELGCTVECICEWTETPKNAE